MVSLFKLSVKKIVKKVLRIILAFLSAFAVVVSILPYTTAFADSSYFLYCTNVGSIEYGVPTSDNGFVVRNKNNDSTTPYSGEYLTFSIRNSSGSLVTDDFTFSVSNLDSSSTYSQTYDIKIWDGTTSSVSYQRNLNLGQTYSFNTGHKLFITIITKSLPRYHDLILDVQVDGVSLFYDSSYSDGYAAGYSVGYSSGVSSVDTSSYYDSGYAAGYLDGLAAGSGDSPISSLGDFHQVSNYVATTEYSSGLTAGGFLDVSHVGDVLTAQELYDRVGSTNNIQGTYTFYRTADTLGSPFVCLLGGLSGDYSVLRTSGFSVPSGHKVLVSLTPVSFNWWGYGPTTTVYKSDGTSGGVVNGSSFTFNMSTSTGSVSRVRVWSGSDNHAQYFEPTLISSGDRYWFVIDSLSDITSRLDFQFYTSSGYWLVSFGYFSNDYSGSLYDLLVNGTSDTSSIVDNASSALDDFNESAGTINDWEDDMLSDFENSSSSISSEVSNFSFSSQFLTASTWVANQMQLGYNHSSDFRIFFIYPILVGIALVFIGGGIGHKKE